MVIGAKVKPRGYVPHIGTGTVEGLRIGRREMDGTYKGGKAIAYVRWETGQVGEWECETLVEMGGK